MSDFSSLDSWLHRILTPAVKSRGKVTVTWPTSNVFQLNTEGGLSILGSRRFYDQLVELAGKDAT